MSAGWAFGQRHEFRVQNSPQTSFFQGSPYAFQGQVCGFAAEADLQALRAIKSYLYTQSMGFQRLGLFHAVAWYV